jgi:hypothetical protein
MAGKNKPDGTHDSRSDGPRGTDVHDSKTSRPDRTLGANDSDHGAESSEDENYTILKQLAKVYKGYTREQRRQLGPEIRELGLKVAKPDEQPAEPGMNDSEDEDSLSVTIGDFARIKTAWRGDFFGDSITVFQSVVGNAQKRFNLNTDYAKFMPIVQSSGMEKSRLIDEYSKFSAGVIFTLRIENQSGYPPGDYEVTNLLRGAPTGNRKSTAHATVVGLLSAAVAEGMGI